MDEYIKQILISSIPVNESIKSSDFSGAVEILQEKIIDIFRFTSILLAPSFLSTMISYIENDANSTDKKKRYAAAVSVSALINLYPFDQNIPQFRPIIEKLLTPGYKPIVQIGSIVLGRVAKIVGPNRDKFLNELVMKAQQDLSPNQNPDVRYAAAAIWRGVVRDAPETLFSIGTSFAATVSATLFYHDANVNDIITETLEILFQSESAVIGSKFLTEIHNILLLTTTKSFSEVQKTDEVIGNLQLLHVLLKLKPKISKKNAENLILPKCIQYITSPNREIAFFSIDTIFQMYNLKVIDYDQDLFNLIYNTLFNWVLVAPSETVNILCIFVSTFKISDLRTTQNLVQSLNTIVSKLHPAVGPAIAFEITVEAIEHFSSNSSNMSILVSNVRQILMKSSVPLPIHHLLRVLNKQHSRWSSAFIVFKNQILHVIKQELNQQSQRTDRLIISLLALCEFPEIDLQSAIELNTQVEKLMTSKDIEVRKLIVAASVHLFRGHTKSLPMNAMIRIVRFALDDSAKSVRLASLRAFTEETYTYLSQQDVLPIFCRFINDESAEIRKAALDILRKLPIVDYTIVRGILLSSLKQMSPNLSVVIPSTIPVWIVFPHVLTAAAPLLHVYADKFFKKFMEMLSKRFTNYMDISLVYTNSAILREVDTCLLKSITRLHLICPEIVPIDPIIKMLQSILLLSVHPYTKIIGMKQLKNLVENDGTPLTDLMPLLLEIIRRNESAKLTQKTLKVVGCLGNSKIKPKKKQNHMMYKSTLTNPEAFKLFYISRIFRHMFKQFGILNTPTGKDAIVHCISILFHKEPSIIPQHLHGFLESFLDYLCGANATNSTLFQYLIHIIADSGFLILPHTEEIYRKLENHLQGEYTKEVCAVLSQIVVSTNGKADKIIQSIVSKAFLLLKSRKDVEMFGPEMFRLLQTIAKYAPGFMPMVVTGISDLLLTPGSPNYMQEFCLDTVEYIITECHRTNMIHPIKRCLEMVASRGQLRWRDRAMQLLRFIESGYPSSYMDSYIGSLPPHEPAAQTLTFGHVLAAMKALVNRDSKTPTTKQIETWFDDLTEFLVNQSSFPVIRAMRVLHELPKFAFKYAFIAAWITFTDPEQKKISKRLNRILELKNLPPEIIFNFVSLAEFALISQIDLMLKPQLVIDKCLQINEYAKALAICECQVTLEGATITQQMTENLINLNMIVGRNSEAHALANRFGSPRFETWMNLGEWSNAMEILNDCPEPNRVVPARIECFAAMENWSEIINLESMFDSQSISAQAHLARYFWTAEMNCGSSSNALEFVELTGGYETEDCIQKGILYVSLNNLSEAQKAVHLGWRYLAATFGKLKKHDVRNAQKCIFQSEQLHQLQEAIHVRSNPSHGQVFVNNWKAKFPTLKEDIAKQRLLYQIIKLTPDLLDLDAFALHVISSTVRAKKRDEAYRLANLFYPDKETAGAIYCDVALMDPQIRSEKALDSLEKLDGVFKVRMENLIGKDLLRNASNIDELHKAQDFLVKAGLNYDKIVDLLVLLAHVTSSENDGLNAVEALKEKMKQTDKARTLYVQHSLALLLKYSENAKICKAISDMYEELNDKIATCSSMLIMELVSHENKNVSDTAASIINRMMNNFDEFACIDLFRETLVHSDNKALSNLVDVVHLKHPIYFSHISTISRKLIDIAHNICDDIIDLLMDFINTKDIKLVNQMEQYMNRTTISQYEREFMDNLGSFVLEFIKSINPSKIEESDISNAHRLLSTLVKRNDSLRVIPLASLDEQLVRKQTWQVAIPCKRAKKSGSKLASFFHSVQKLDDSFLVSMLDTSGKKYSFILSKSERSDAHMSEQFNDLLMNIVPNLNKRLQSRSNFQLSIDVTLREKLKRRAPILELIASYRATQGMNDTLEVNRSVKEMIESNADREDLSKAILVTSANAMNWLERQAMFARSLGALSALSYIYGGMNTALDALLFDKATGSVDMTAFSIAASPPPVPFRMTKMVEAALGTCGTSGPFSENFAEVLEQLRKYRRGIAPLVQFAVSDGSFKSKVPRRYTLGFCDAPPDCHTDIDVIYERIYGNGQVVDEINELIYSAKSIDNLIQMPLSWIPWW